MKRIRFVGIFILITLSIVMVSCMHLGFAATTDVTPPELKSFNISTDIIKPGDYIDVYVEAEDDISGLSTVTVTLYSLLQEYDVYQYELEKVDGTYKMYIPEDMIGGDYLVSYVVLEDNSGNFRFYNNRYLDPEADYPFDLGNKIIKIISDVNYGDDTEAPIVSNVTINKKKIHLGEQIRYCAKVKDDSDIEVVALNPLYKNQMMEYGDEYMQYEEDIDSYCAYVTPKRTGIHTISSIYVSDKFSNSRLYFTRAHTELITVEGYSEFLSMPEVEVIGEEKDIEPPIVSSAKLNKQSVGAPSTIKMFLDASDNSGEIKYATASFISEKLYNQYRNTGIISSGEVRVSLQYDKVLDKYVGNIELNQYTAPGKYFLEYVTLTDASDNAAAYYSEFFPDNPNAGYRGNLLKKGIMNSLTFEVKKDFEYDVITSTVKSNLLDIIKEQKDDAIIMIDATNNTIIEDKVFETIKGTNKTIYIELEGYQWVFNGKDIINPKDIDVSVHSELLVDYNINNKEQEYVAIIFEDNGMLPGKAKIRVKTDYTFRYIEGYEELFLYYFNPSESKYKPMDAKITLTEDGFYEFEITHNSKYVMSNKILESKLITKKDDIIDKVEETTKEEAKEDQDNNPYIIISIVIVLVVVVATILMFIIKKKIIDVKKTDAKLEE